MAGNCSPPTSAWHRRSAAAPGSTAPASSSCRGYTIQGTTYNDVGSAFVAVNAQLGAAGGSPYFKANSSGPAAQATGTDALAMGSNAQSGGSNSVAIGTNSVASQSGAIAMGFNAAATGVNAIAIGTGATATGSVAMGADAAAANGGAAYGDNSVATGANAAAFGPGAQATAANSVAIGAGSVASAANTVSVGAPGAERRVTNVAAGIAPTDAVNMAQLSSMASGFQSQIDDNRTEARAGTALALAAAGLPLDDRPGKLSFATAFGHFMGQSGIAAGLGYAPTVNTRFNASATATPQSGNYGMTVGASFTLN